MLEKVFSGSYAPVAKFRFIECLSARDYSSALNILKSLPVGGNVEEKLVCNQQTFVAWLTEN